jgi:hypothetical protein
MSIYRDTVYTEKREGAAYPATYSRHNPAHPPHNRQA